MILLSFISNNSNQSNFLIGRGYIDQMTSHCFDDYAIDKKIVHLDLALAGFMVME